MPNYVGNSIIVIGPEQEISRLVGHCFRPIEIEDDDGDYDETEVEFGFDTVIPIDAAALDAAAGAGECDALYRRHWGTNRDALDSTIIDRRPGYLHFEFITASDLPEPVYRELGRTFPALEFDIAAMDPGASWAVTGRVMGREASFDAADLSAVYERIYKEPLPVNQRA